jgi:hypothetical protein
MMDIFTVPYGINKLTLALGLRWFLDVSFRPVLVSLLSVFSLSILIICLDSHDDTFDHVSTLYPGEIRCKCNGHTNTIRMARFYAVFGMPYEAVKGLLSSNQQQIEGNSAK